MTVLIGRNNEGKSNLLKALGTAMRLLQLHAFGPRRYRTLLTAENAYEWKRDFPIQHQDRKSSTQTTIKLEFQLSDIELDEFYKEIKSKLNGSLPLEIRIGKDNEPHFRVVKSGRGAKSLTQKSEKIAQFIASRIYFNYIPAVRTEKDALNLIGTLVGQELRALEEDPAYKSAIDTISQLQQPILDTLATQVKDALHEFLPNIRSVKIDLSDLNPRFTLRRDVDVIVDDGVATNIAQKGDGVKSLAALGLLKSKNVRPGASVLAIEEPESHLHPAAIHRVNEIIQAISQTSQVIITTHNPLFVDRVNLKSNIIVTDGGATPSKNISQIRDLLGIKASDNLINANYVLIVEGPEDRKSLMTLLPAASDKIYKAIKNNLLVIDPLGGAGNLPYKISILKNALCATHVLLDNDESGKSSFLKAEKDGLLTPLGCTFTACKGKQSSEFEDMLNPDIYKQKILEQFGVNLDSPSFKGKKKWSERIETAFKSQGKLIFPETLSAIKGIVSDEVQNNRLDSLHPQQRDSFDALVNALELLIKI